VLEKIDSQTGTANVVIWKSDDSTAVTIETVDVSTITTSDAVYTFTKAYSTY
jgi:hypothetical protein